MVRERFGIGDVIVSNRGVLEGAFWQGGVLPRFCFTFLLSSPSSVFFYHCWWGM